jgi:hypothetical protein
VLTTRFVSPRSSSGGRGASTGTSRMGGVDLALALGVGALAALMVVSLPWILVLIVAIAFCGLAVATRLDMRTMAETLLLLSSFMMPMNQVWAGPAPASDVLLCLALGLYVLIRLHERERSEKRPYRPVVIGLTILAIGGLVGSAFEVHGPFLYKALGEPLRDVSGLGQNLGNEMKFLLGSFIPMTAWILCRPDRPFMRKLVGAFVAGGVVSALVGILLPSGHPGSRMIGLTVHPGQFGSLSLLALGSAMGLLLSRPPFRAWGYVVLPILAFAILGSGSRAALGGMAVLALILGPMTRNKAVMAGLFVGVAAVLVLFATGVVRPEGENALGRAFGGASSAAGSDAVRGDLHREVFGRWEMRPLTGNGFNYMRPSHNVYLGIIASTGVLGVIGFLVILNWIFRRLWRRRADLLAMGVGAAYLAYLCAAYFDNIFWWRWLWFFVGMVVAVTTTRPGPDEIVVEGSPPLDDDVEDEAPPPVPAARPATLPLTGVPKAGW